MVVCPWARDELVVTEEETEVEVVAKERKEMVGGKREGKGDGRLN